MCEMKCLFPQDAESIERGRQWRDGELGKSELIRPNKLLPEFWHTDEIVFSTIFEPAEGDIVALARGEWNDCEIEIYDESIQGLIDSGAERLLGVVVETRHDWIVHPGDSRMKKVQNTLRPVMVIEEWDNGNGCMGFDRKTKRSS
jgi:hypothetical protein